MASAAAGAAETVASTKERRFGEVGYGAAVGFFREDAPFEKLGKGELRGGISKRDLVHH